MNTDGERSFDVGDAAEWERWETMRRGYLATAECFVRDEAFAALRYALSEPCRFVTKVAEEVQVAMGQANAEA